MTKRKVEKDYHDLAKSRGFTWVGDILPKNIKVKTLWKCKKYHQWLATYSNIHGGWGCPYCSCKIRKMKKDYHELAESRGFKWVGKKLPKNIQVKTLWECKNGHQWPARYNDIYNGSGCPYCSGKIRKTEKDYHELAESRGFKWVDKKLPKNVMTKTLWECKKGHWWPSHYNSINTGSGCPYCDTRINGCKVSKLQIKLNKLLNGYLNYPEARYRVDVAIMRNSQKIAVEYDAQYWHQGREEHDKKRDKFLISRGWKVLHVKSGERLPTRKQLKKAINKLLSGKDLVNIYLDDWKV